MPKSNFLSTQIIGHVFGKSTYTAPAQYFVALCKIAPLASDTGSTISEVAYTNYARFAMTSANFTAVTANAVSNSAQLAFATPGATGDVAYGWAICDAATLGNVLYFDALAALPILPGVAPIIPANMLSIGES